MSQQYNKAHPFLSRIKERYSLCKEGSQKNTFHVVLDLEGSGITYQVGDSIAVQPTNDPQLVETMLKLLHANGTEMINGKHSQEPLSLKEYLMTKVSLAEVQKKLLVELALKQINPEKKERLEFLVSEGQRESLKEYQAAHEVWDTLAENDEVHFTPEEFCHLLQPLLPRFYSIASSMSKVGNEVHLMIADLQYETNGHKRKGICTHFLGQLAEINSTMIPVYIQPSNGFTLPENDALPIIMIGPGTGVAPYRAFMQERQARQALGTNWLFFGEWHKATEFFYEEDWKKFSSTDNLRLETAFSRDQEHKLYVQHLMLDHGKEIYDLLENGAYFYVCGDAHRMAKDVDAALHLLIRVHGNLEEVGAKDYVKKLRASKRYLRDVY